MPDDFEQLVDYQGIEIRLTSERWQHILEHPEMQMQRDRIVETLASPDMVIATVKDETIHVYHRLYKQTPVTRKYMTVAVKKLLSDAFVVTAFYSSRIKRGIQIWQK